MRGYKNIIGKTEFTAKKSLYNLYNIEYRYSGEYNKLLAMRFWEHYTEICSLNIDIIRQNHLHFCEECGIIIMYIYSLNTRGAKMTVCYNKLWKLLIDRKMKKKDLVALSGVSKATIANL